MATFKSSPSSLSSLSTGRRTYDVFLSFRGEDTRDNFVDHFYTALFQRGINVFKDKKIRMGKSIAPELLKAIEESRFAVVIFSENYANSSWCLDELAKIMECQDRIGQKVIPVFYHVDPSDVRGQKGNFATAFQQHEEKFRGEMDKVNKWKEALVAAANTCGSHILKTGNGGESEFINKIVQEILGALQPHGMENDLIGMEYHMDALNSIMGIEATEEVRVVGIWGMGGIGKTTIAHALYRRIAYKFEGSSFLKNVRENSSSEGEICALQEKVLKDILVMDNEYMYPDAAYRAAIIEERFRNKKVLLVLDDVDHVKQLEHLAATREWFGPGSRIIITTRDEHLLSDANASYKPALLLEDQALELFSRHAFRKNSPPEAYEELSYRAIRYTGYLPLALKVLGSFFRGRQACVWESALNRLAKAPNPEIFESLKLSFDGLTVVDKEIFLDIACFFKGRDKEHVTRILDSFGFDAVLGISVLIEKSLITVSKKKLDMHDLIQDMGWKIVRESFPNSRLWQLEAIHDFIKGNRKLKKIEAIMLPEKPYHSYEYDETLGFSAEVFKHMTNLRLLDIDWKFTSHEPTFLPDKLRWFCWNEYPFSSLPVAHMQKLVGLEMLNGKVKNLWKEQEILPKLKFIHLEGLNWLTRFPDVSGAPNVERLILSSCRSLVEVHESLGSHRRLVYLDMSGCRQLKCLPSKIEMESLETLILSECYALEGFPEVSPRMVKLSKIYLDSCLQIEELPSSIRYLSSLSFLNLTNCENLKNIPNSICELKHLKSLHLHNCKELQKLPKELGSTKNLEDLRLGITGFLDIQWLPGSISFHILTNLCSLRKLDLSWRQIEEESFPKNLHVFSSLEELYLSGNSKLTQLPTSISHLSRLKRLELNECCRLEILHALPSGIQVLKASGCSSLENIGDLSKEHEWLYKIQLIRCRKLPKEYLDKMLQQSFLKKCAAVGHRLSIAIPRSKIPNWFKEQQHGCTIVLKLPPKWHTQIMGFAVCGVFHGDWRFPKLARYASPQIIFRIENDGKIIPKSQVDCINASAEAENGNVWISYIPFGLFHQMYHNFLPDDWSHIQGNLVMTLKLTNGEESVRCGAHILYKEDVESIQQKKTGFPDYGNLVHLDGDNHHKDLGYDENVSSNNYVYEEKSDDDDENLMPLRSRTSRRRIKIAAEFNVGVPRIGGGLRNLSA